MWGIADAITLDGYNKVWMDAGGYKIFPYMISGWALLPAPITNLTLCRSGLPAITGEHLYFKKRHYIGVSIIDNNTLLL
jgi:hypothetical protein